MILSGEIHRISVSKKRGTKKHNIDCATIIASHGIDGDAHAGPHHRQISLLPLESFAKVRTKLPSVEPGDFAENITVSGLDFGNTKVGQCLLLGETTKLRVTQIGKTCHKGCYIRTIVGDCIMPREGIFTEVIEGGNIAVGDSIRWEEDAA